jgi:hypothetical protein
MSHILYAWELGRGYGHVAGVLPLVRKLRRDGHTVTLALRDLSRVDVLLSGDALPVLQAPVWFPETVGLPPAVNYAEILFVVGYLTAAGLESLVRGWRALFARVRPDLLIVDHAPTALVASRGLTMARALFGSGFFSPPRVHPMPSIRPSLAVPPDRLLQSEQRAVDVINTVLDRLHAPPLRILADLFDVDEDFLCTFAELDHYPDRPGAHYWGAQFLTTEGAPPEWPAGAGHKIFAYVEPAHRDFERMLQHLGEGPHRVLVHAPGTDDRIRRRYGAPSLEFAAAPLQMARVTAECDLVVCHGGSGTVVATLLAGRPLLLLPLHPDHSLTARAVVELGAGVMVPEDEVGISYRRLLTEALAPAYRERARAFADRYADFDQDRQVERMTARCSELLGASIAPGRAPGANAP